MGTSLIFAEHFCNMTREHLNVNLFSICSSAEGKFLSTNIP